MKSYLARYRVNAYDIGSTVPHLYTETVERHLTAIDDKQALCKAKMEIVKIIDDRFGACVTLEGIVEYRAVNIRGIEQANKHQLKLPFTPNQSQVNQAHP